MTFFSSAGVSSVALIVDPALSDKAKVTTPMLFSPVTPAAKRVQSILPAASADATFELQHHGGTSVPLQYLSTSSTSLEAHAHGHGLVVALGACGFRQPLFKLLNAARNGPFEAIPMFPMLIY